MTKKELIKEIEALGFDFSIPDGYNKADKKEDLEELYTTLVLENEKKLKEEDEKIDFSEEVNEEPEEDKEENKVEDNKSESVKKSLKGIRMMGEFFVVNGERFREVDDAAIYNYKFLNGEL